MARNVDPVCRMCRREQMKLYLKAERCFSPKCPIDREALPPGMHGARRSKQSEYGIRLREKQKLKRFYGVFEAQFRRYYVLATRAVGNTGEQLLSILERRLDNVVHRLGFAGCRSTARQMVNHGHILVNGKRVNIPSYQVRDDDVIEVKDKSKQLAVVLDAAQSSERDVPEYLEVDHRAMKGRFARAPKLTDVPYPVQMEPNLVVEYYSR